MPQEARISLGNGIGIGLIQLAPSPIRGEGGAANARLVIRLKVTINAQPKERMLALTDLTASLYLGSATVNQQTRLGSSVRLDLLPSFCFRSLPGSSNENVVEIPFPVSPPQIALVERYRHSLPNAHFEAALSLHATVVLLMQTLNESTNPFVSPVPAPQSPVPLHWGMYSVLAPFWTSGIEDLIFQIPASTWVETVLPGWDFDRLRLLEIALPQQGGFFPDTIIAYFDAAQRNYDLGRYREAMSNCRDVRTAIEQHLAATKNHPIDVVIIEQLGLPSNAPQGVMARALWQTLQEATNEAHHIPGGPLVVEADARMCLHCTAIFVEYVGRLLH